jgi:hypothetical protein
VKKELSATVIKTTALETVPSGSALEMVADRLNIISDDARYIYQFIKETGLLRDSIRLVHLAGEDRRIPKPLKPDYEAAVSTKVFGEDCLIAFGSGSLRPQRDSALIISVNHSGFQKVVSLEALYAAMRKEAGIRDEDFNIEAAALHENHLLLINRGSNHVFSMDWALTLKHMLESAPAPSISASSISLDKTGDYPTGISGACFLNADQVLFSASAEATTNWIADGEVLGSYVGILKLDKTGKAQLQGITPVVTETGKPVKDKIEGISIYKSPENNVLTVLCIVDNDDGTSRLLEVRINNLPSL